MRYYLHNNRMKWRTLVVLSLVLFGLVLLIDELWMFGIPIGGLLPDMTQYHLDSFHHWMLGVVLLFGGIVMYRELKV
jgi:hypothetical protein